MADKEDNTQTKAEEESRSQSSNKVDDAPDEQQGEPQSHPNHMPHHADDPANQCGFGNYKPESLQKLHTAKALLCSLCLCSIVQGFVINGIIPNSITTLEKKFHLTSTETGLFSGFYDIATMCIVVPISYYGNKGHKGTWCAIGMVILGLGSFLCSLPQFVTGPYQTPILSSTCVMSNSSMDEVSMDCDSSSTSSLRLFLYVLLAGQVLHGFGASPLYTLGITYLDENVTQLASPVYLSIYMASASAGPALGFLLGGVFLRVYGDVGKVDVASLDLSGPDDPRWYGAWWLGFIVAGVGAIAASIPLFTFGRQLPEQHAARSKDVNQAHEHDDPLEDHKDNDLNHTIHDLPKHILKLLRNPTFSWMVVMQCSDSFLLNGFVTFVPKIFENLFNLSASSAAMFTGMVTVPSCLIGTILGGYVIRKFNLKCKKIMGITIGGCCVTFVATFCMFIRCSEAPLAGAHVGYLMDEGVEFTPGALHECNVECGCSNIYNPVCSSQLQVSFYSPCHAGCTNTSNDSKGAKMWHNCSCVMNNGNSDKINNVTQGVCPVDCIAMPFFLIGFSILVLSQFFVSMPVQQTVLRSVRFDQRSLAMGLQWIFIRLFGVIFWGNFMRCKFPNSKRWRTIPGALTFGSVIDLTCILWKEKCGEKLSCVQYEDSKMTLGVVLLALTTKAISILALCLALKFYKPPPNVDQKDTSQ